MHDMLYTDVYYVYTHITIHTRSEHLDRNHQVDIWTSDLRMNMKTTMITNEPERIRPRRGELEKNTTPSPFILRGKR